MVMVRGRQVLVVAVTVAVVVVLRTVVRRREQVVVVPQATPTQVHRLLHPAPGVGLHGRLLQHEAAQPPGHPLQVRAF